MASKKTTRRNDARGNGKWQGMNWCRQDLRLAIHLRDGLACAWCGHAHEDGASLTLDHLKPHSKGGEELCAIADAAERFWAAVGDGDQRSTHDQLVAVGLVRE